MCHVISCESDKGGEGGQYLGDDLADVSVHGLVGHQGGNGSGEAVKRTLHKPLPFGVHIAHHEGLEGGREGGREGGMGMREDDHEAAHAPCSDKKKGLIYRLENIYT